MCEGKLGIVSSETAAAASVLSDADALVRVIKLVFGVGTSLEVVMEEGATIFPEMADAATTAGEAR
jgi:hypothetical protein